MDKSFFKFKKATNIKELKDGDTLPESDFSLFTSEDTFVQFDFIELEDDTKLDKYPIKAGIYTISTSANRMLLKDANFSDDRLLEEYIVTKDISDKITTFFNRTDVYKQYGIFPKRGILLYGSQGCGKSVALSKICNDYAKAEDTTVVIWPSDKFEARNVKDFIKSFDYDKYNIKKIILVIEDLGGTEHTDRGISPSQSSLLSLLDNVNNTFTIPTMIVATTNFPENFLENLTDRPQRFDDVIEVKKPSSEFRAKFLEFFSQNLATAEDLDFIKGKQFDGFSVAHVKEVVIRSALYGKSLKECLEQVQAQSAKAKKGFSNAKKMGFGE